MCLKFLHAVHCCLSVFISVDFSSTFHFNMPLFIALFPNTSHCGLRQSQIITSYQNKCNDMNRERDLWAGKAPSFVTRFILTRQPDPLLHFLTALVSSAISSVFCMSHSGWLQSDNPIKSTSGKPVAASHTRNGITVQWWTYNQSRCNTKPLEYLPYLLHRLFLCFAAGQGCKSSEKLECFNYRWWTNGSNFLEIRCENEQVVQVQVRAICGDIAQRCQFTLGTLCTSPH